jgi:hypothetical protein
MAENRNEVVVTEQMITKAVLDGDLESLTLWARRRVRVTSGRPLCVAAWDGHLEVVRILVRDLGANANQTSYGDTPLIAAAHGDHPAVVRCLIEYGADVNHAVQGARTPLHIAAGLGYLAVVRCLVEKGARIGAVNFLGNTALLESALHGRYTTVQYLLEEADANMDDVNNDGVNVWDMLVQNLEDAANDDGEEGVEDDLQPLTGLLRVMVLRGAPPPALVALLSPEPARVVQEGARLRARLPVYLVRRRALLDAHCPVLLPPLRALVHGYMELTTIEELWATGLGTAR